MVRCTPKGKLHECALLKPTTESPGDTTESHSLYSQESAVVSLCAALPRYPEENRNLGCSVFAETLLLHLVGNRKVTIG